MNTCAVTWKKNIINYSKLQICSLQLKQLENPNRMTHSLVTLTHSYDKTVHALS